MPSTPDPSRRESALRRLVRAAERVVGAIVNAAMGLAALGVLVAFGLIVYAVIARYFFNAAPIWVDDTVGFLLVGIVVFAAAGTLRRGQHIAVDVLTLPLARRGGKLKIAIELWSLLAVMVFAVLLIVNGWETAMSSRMLEISTSGTVEIPVYWLELLLPLCGAMMLLVALEALLRIAAGLPPLAVQEHHAEEDAA